MDATQFISGVGFAVLGGVLQGAMLWPMKFTEKWEWENTWLGFSVAAYLVAPWILAFTSVPRLLDVLGTVPSRPLILALLFGLAWGLGTVLFGLGIAMVGLGVGYAIIMGLTISVGTFVPLFVLAPDEALAARGLVLFVGVITVILGTALCSYAGRLREQELGIAAPQQGSMLRSTYATGFLVCVLAGMLIPGGNLALTFGQEILIQARSLGATELNSVNALWAVAMFPLFFCSAVYCLYLLQHKRTLKRFRMPGTGHYWVWVVLMGAAQMAGIAFYGFGAASLGPLGPSIGFPLLMSSMILTANLLGFKSGEWRGVGGRPTRIMTTGLIVLVGAICLLGYGNRPNG